MATQGVLDSLSPWSSRTVTPQPAEKSTSEHRAGLAQQQGGDHRVNPRHRANAREYPDDAPALKVRWFFSESPKRKPQALCKPGDRSRPPVASKKFLAFSGRDSRSIEHTFQELAEAEDRYGSRKQASTDAPEGTIQRDPPSDGISDADLQAPEASSAQSLHQRALVPVNEDFLFDVDIDARELAPSYWLGPIYEVRRGTWFYQDGSSSRPCDENLATQLEEGYIKTKPWRNIVQAPPRSTSGSRSRPTSWKPSESRDNPSATGSEVPLPSFDGSPKRTRDGSIDSSTQPKFQLQTHRLFGSYMNSVVTYQDAKVAWLLTDDFLSRMSSTVYQRFSGGGHLGGIKVVRGFVESANQRDNKGDSNALNQQSNDESRGRPVDIHKQPEDPASMQAPVESTLSSEGSPETESNTRRLELERRMATIVESPGLPDPAAEEEEVRKREEAEIQQDYQKGDDEEQGREIDHLVFVTHGIGQRLGLKMESLSFIHDVNVLRKTLKSVYGNSHDLQALNSEEEKTSKNCRIQVLPIVWRHLLDFPRPVAGPQRREQDLSDGDSSGDDPGYPILDDITVEGVPAIRNLVEDLFLDILLYQSAYREHIADIVQRECNRVFKLFKQRNPQFRGKVSFIGHSLGSAILFDLLCWQRDSKPLAATPQNGPSMRRASYQKGQNGLKDFSLDFEVEDFYCLGSPIGLFQMINGRTISARQKVDASTAKEPWDALAAGHVSSPRCQQIFNIFHPTDPVAYRIEPLISSAMKALKPQPLPYVKKSLFGAPGIGLTGIGARVGQSVSGLWSNIATGVASTLLNRSLGLTSDVPSVADQPKKRLSMAEAMDIARETTGDRASEKDGSQVSESTEPKSKKPQENPKATRSEEETLYTGFQRHQSGNEQGHHHNVQTRSEWQQAEMRARQVRAEEAKIKALNANGRVDFNIQEGVFDISLIASLASHLSYWADEDVSHFVISQLLSSQRSKR